MNPAPPKTTAFLPLIIPGLPKRPRVVHCSENVRAGPYPDSAKSKSGMNQNFGTCYLVRYLSHDLLAIMILPCPLDLAMLKSWNPVPKGERWV
jgi:hypothetical protein